MITSFINTNIKYMAPKIKTIPFTLTTKIMKYLGIILEKHVQDLYPENYKMLKKKIREDLNKWRDLSCS